MKPLHHALREARVRAGLTQTQAAELSGIARGQISDLERAEGKKPLHTGATLKTLRTGEVPPADRRMNVKERRVVDLVLEAMRAE